VVTYQGGPLLVDINPVALWASITWADGTHSFWPPGLVQCRVDQFFSEILYSSYMTTLRNVFSQPGYQIGSGLFLGTHGLGIKSRANPSKLDDSDIRAALEDDVTNGLLPTSTGEACYFVMTPPDVTVVNEGQESGVPFSAYHSEFTTQQGQQVFYCVITTNLLSELGDLLENLTHRISHELAETITDPFAGSPYIPGNPGWIGPDPDRKSNKLLEVCDYCSDPLSIKVIGGFVVNPFVVEGKDIGGISFSCGPDGDTVPRSNVDKASITFDRSLTRTTCLGDIIEGQEVYFGATATHRNSPAIIQQITWANGDQDNKPLPEVNGKDKRIYIVAVPWGVTSVTVHLTVFASLGCIMYSNKTFVVVSQAAADQQGAACALVDRLREMYPRPPYLGPIAGPDPGPIWEPGRDLSVNPLTRAELGQLVESAKRLEGFAREAQPLLEELAVAMEPFAR
jgi:hypothetical protein